MRTRKRECPIGAEEIQRKGNEHGPFITIRSARRRPLRRRLLPRIIVPAVTLALLVGIIALVRVASLSTPAGSNTATTTGASTGGTSSAPDFTLPLLSGTTFQLAAKLGHPVVLYFMSPTCATCARGSRNLAQASQSIKTQGAEVLAIDVNPGDRPADLQAFVQSDGIPASAPMQWGVDPNDAIASAYNVQTLETTVVIDPHGQVAYRSDGSVPPDQLVQIVKNLA